MWQSLWLQRHPGVHICCAAWLLLYESVSCIWPNASEEGTGIRRKTHSERIITSRQKTPQAAQLGPALHGNNPARAAGLRALIPECFLGAFSQQIALLLNTQAWEPVAGLLNSPIRLFDLMRAVCSGVDS